MAKEKSLIDTSKNLLTEILNDKDVEFIETGNIGFDLALSNGKGIPVGASVLLWADPGCGKSTILADVSKRLLKRSKKNNIPFKVLYIVFITSLKYSISSSLFPDKYIFLY